MVNGNYFFCVFFRFLYMPWEIIDTLPVEVLGQQIS